MKTKLTIRTYECKHCNNYFYIRSDQEFSKLCKVCKRPVEFISERPYNPQNGLRAIGASNLERAKNTNDERANISKLSVECPYCHSTDTKKITIVSKVLNTAIWGFLGTKRFKEWHCNKCGSDF